MLKIPAKQLPLEKLGSGASGNVYLSTYAGRNVAVKAVETKAALDDESAILHNLEHPNIIRLIGTSVMQLKNTLHYTLVLEYAALGTLYSFLHDIEANESTRESWVVSAEIIRLIVEMLKGFAYLHSQKVLHGDVKPNNLLLDAACRVKICDFDKAVKVPSLDTPYDGPVGGTLPWTPPEVLLSFETDTPSAYFHTSDTRSLALIIWYLFTFKLPYQDDNVPGSHRQKVKRICAGPPPAADGITNNTVRTLYLNQMQPSPRDRFSAAHMLRAVETEYKHVKRDRSKKCHIL